MKKFFMICSLLLPITVFADDMGIHEPEWKDFAPTAYIDVKAPKGIIGKLNVTAKYWYERKTAFEDGILECQAIQTYEERFNCYEILKIKQFKENTDYNARIEAKQNPSMEYNDPYNRTDSMIPLNNYINTFSTYMPNELH